MNDYTNKTVLITGGTGSFGTTISRHLLDRGIGEIRILSRDEAKQHHMRVTFNDARLQFHIGDVRDPLSLDRVTAGADMVFHAAALKQVPSCEFFPIEAVMTNVLGSSNVLDAAHRHQVKSVVCLSTDKAVLPVNAMGMTKALMEKTAQAVARSASSDTSETIVSTVRFGNVLYSRGSVVPLFVDKIFRSEALTVTDPEMTRFLLPLGRAVELVEFAFFNADRGDTFVKKSAAATIGDLASAVNDLFGNPVEIQEIGVRHGEKLFETLATEAELENAEDLGEYWRLRMDSRSLNYADYFEVGSRTPRDDVQDYHSHNAPRLDVASIQELLVSLPEVRNALDEWAARS